MEAIPLVGEFLARKLCKDLVEGPRCSNWTGLAKVSYDDIILLESTFKTTDSIYAYISSTGNLDIYESADYLWPDEERDGRVDNLKNAIIMGNDFGDYIWESIQHDEAFEEVDDQSFEEDDNQSFEEDSEAANVVDDNISISQLRRGKKKLPDTGAEQRKRQFLCQRTTGRQEGITEDMKSFIQEIFNVSFSSLEEKLDKKYAERIGKLESQLSQLNNSLTEFTKIAETATTSKPSVANNLQSNVAAENIWGVLNNVSMGVDDVLFSPSCDMYKNLGTQEYLQKTVGLLSQDTLVSGFDPTQTHQDVDTDQCSTPEKSSFKEYLFNVDQADSPELHTPYVGDKMTKKVFSETTNVNDNRKKQDDDLLVYFSEKSFKGMLEWSNKRETLKFGPSVIDVKLLTRLITPGEWFQNEDIDAVMYLFRENTALGRLPSDRVAFMNCLFGVQLKVEYEKFLKDRRRFKWDSFMQAYGNGELPSHGKTKKQWGTDVDRIYTPVNISNSHWISLCINLIQRTIEVFDCTPCWKTTGKSGEPFKVAIPRILKAVLPTYIGKDLNVTPFSVIQAPVKDGLNKSSCDCGPYALKFIECHFHGLDICLLNDDNIQEARMKIAIDLWQAASDPLFINRMSKYEPTQFDSDVSVIDLT